MMPSHALHWLVWQALEYGLPTGVMHDEAGLIPVFCSRPFKCIVVEKLFYQVYMRHQHAPAAVAAQAKRIKCISAGHKGDSSDS